MRGRGQGPHALGAPAPKAREAGGGAHRGCGQHTVAPRIGHVGAGEVVPEHAAHPVVVALLGLQDQLPRKPLLGAAAPEATPAALQDGAHLPAGVCLLVPGDAGRFAVSESRGHRPPEAPPRALPAHSPSWFPNPLTASSVPSPEPWGLHGQQWSPSTCCPRAERLSAWPGREGPQETRVP